jgi:DNA polymerase-3 subunit delta
MRIDAEQLPQQLKRGLASLYVILGDEPLLALEAGDRLRAAAREQGYTERTLLMVESGFDWDSLGAASASLSLFSERRLIELRIPTGKPGVTGAQAIIEYCGNLAPDTVTIVHLPAMDWKAVQAEWFQTLERAGAVIEARIVERGRLPRWLAARMSINGQSSDETTLQFIADRVEGNLLAAWQEVQKLSLLFPAGKLEAAAVRKAVLDVARFDIDDASAALIAGDGAHFVRILDHLQAEGVGLPLVLWAVTHAVRGADMLGRALDRGLPLAGALKEARIFGPRRNTLERAARRWPAARLRQALLRSARIDRMIKGLDRGDPWDELRDLGLSLSAPAPRMSAERRESRGS